MATTINYYSDTATAGTGTASDPYPFLVSGSLHSSITGFNFNGNTLVAYVKGGVSYSLTTSIASGIFTVAAPSRTGSLILRAAVEVDDDPPVEPEEPEEESNEGSPPPLQETPKILVPWEPPNRNWVSAIPEWDGSDMPSLETSGNIATADLNYVDFYGFKIKATGRSGFLITCTSLQWCIVENAQTNTAARGPNNVKQVIHSVFKMTGTSFDYALNVGVGSIFNCRIECNPSATAGNRNGINMESIIRNQAQNCTVISARGTAINVPSTSNSGNINTLINRCTVYDSTNGVFFAQTGTIVLQHVTGCMFAGTGSGTGASRNTTNKPSVLIDDNYWYNFGTAIDNDLADIRDANLDYERATSVTLTDVFVNPSAGDYRIKKTHPAHGRSVGAGDEPVTESGGTTMTSFSMRGGFTN